MSSDGVISGVVADTATTYPVTVTASDSHGNTGSAVLSLTVQPLIT